MRSFYLYCCASRAVTRYKVHFRANKNRHDILGGGAMAICRLLEQMGIYLVYYMLEYLNAREVSMCPFGDGRRLKE